MFWVIILFLSLTTAFDEDSQTTTMHPDALIKRYQMECIEETRVDLDTIAKLRSKNWRMHYNQFALVKDWALCVLMKSGVMTKEGVYKIDVAMERVPLEVRYVLEAQIDACLTPKPMPARDIAKIQCTEANRRMPQYKNYASELHCLLFYSMFSADEL